MRLIRGEIVTVSGRTPHFENMLGVGDRALLILKYDDGLDIISARQIFK
jgi:hypothetical protein